MMRRPLTDGRRRSVKSLGVYGKATPIFDTMKLGKTLSWLKGFPRKFWAKTRPYPPEACSRGHDWKDIKIQGFVPFMIETLEDQHINSFIQGQHLPFLSREPFSSDQSR